MASISRRGDYQFQAIVRRKGYKSHTKTFETRADAEKWARNVESKMDMGRFQDRRKYESTTLSDPLSVADDRAKKMAAQSDGLYG